MTGAQRTLECGLDWVMDRRACHPYSANPLLCMLCNSHLVTVFELLLVGQNSISAYVIIKFTLEVHIHNGIL
jgi:hypothetical protein